MPNRRYDDDRFEYEEIQEQGFIRTVKRPKPGPAPLTPDERQAALEARVATLEADVTELKKLLKPAAAK